MLLFNLQIRIQAVHLEVNQMLLKLQFLLLLLRYILKSWKESCRNIVKWNFVHSLSVENFLITSFSWQENLGSGANLDQKKSDLGDSEVENSEFISWCAWILKWWQLSSPLEQLSWPIFWSLLSYLFYRFNRRGGASWAEFSVQANFFRGRWPSRG